MANFLKILGKLIDFTLGKQKKFPIYTRTWDPFCFPAYLFHGMNLFTYLPPFNTTTLIKPMNEEEEEAPSEDPRVRRNRLAQKRHTWFKENKYGLKKPGDFTVSKDHGYPLIFYYYYLQFKVQKIKQWL